MSKVKDLPIIEQRNCLRCGKQFGINSRQKRKLYCDDCKEVHMEEYLQIPRIKQMKKDYQKIYLQRQKEKYIPRRHKAICQVCQTAFIVGSGRQPKLCIDCLSKSKYAAERERASYRRDYSSEEQIRLSN